VIKRNVVDKLTAISHFGGPKAAVMSELSDAL
jgi:hypothetical protein